MGFLGKVKETIEGPARILMGAQASYGRESACMFLKKYDIIMAE